MNRLAFFILAVLLGAPPARAEPPISFRGKTITVLVGSEPGGGTDAAGRLLARYLHQYLPGEPNTVVQNMPGATGITALNYFVHRTQPDGLTVVMGTISSVDPVVIHGGNAQFDPTAFRFVGGIGRGGSAIVLNAAAATRLYDKSARPVIVGSELAKPHPAIQPVLWCIEYLGWNATWVTGYRGTDETMLALDRGEIDMTSTADVFQIKDRLDGGQIKLLLQTGSLQGGVITGRPEFGGAPLFPDLMHGRIKDPIASKAFELWGAMNGGDKFLALAPATPNAIVTAYRDAFAQLAADQDFLRQGARISEGFAPTPARDVESIMATLAATPMEAVDYTKALMRKQGLRIQ